MNIRYFMFRCKRWFSENATLLYLFFGICVLTFLAITSTIYWSDVYNWLGLSAPDKQVKEVAQFYRNRGFALAALVGLFITIIGMGLTIWGRILTQKQTKQIQQQIKLSGRTSENERYENATRLLGDPLLAARVAGCNALGDLGSSNVESYGIVLRCVNLLSAYISNPYLDENEKREFNSRSSTAFHGRSVFEFIFPTDKALRTDIQAAANSISFIYDIVSLENNSEMEGLEWTQLKLPHYFWRNTVKEQVFLPNAYLRKASLYSASLQNAGLRWVDFKKSDLRYANLTSANLSYANLKSADLAQADLSDADVNETKFKNSNLSGTDLRETKNLTKEQILSATWGYTWINKKAMPKKPKLPKEFLQDVDIKKWLEKPHHNIYVRKAKTKVKAKAKIKLKVLKARNKKA